MSPNPKWFGDEPWISAGLGALKADTAQTELEQSPRGQAQRARVHTLRFTGEVIGVQTQCVNDPSAGSPTETLLRLLLPLSDKVH